jgi:hypothetical protein
MNPNIAKLVSSSLGQNLASQLALAEQIPLILNSLPGTSLQSRFLAFLESWLPIGNRKALLAIASSSPSLLSIDNITAVGPILDTLLSLDDPLIPDILHHSMDSVTAPQIKNLISFLSHSKFDCSRVFACQLLPLIRSDTFFLDSKIPTFSEDKSFLVRNCLAKISPKFSPNQILVIVNFLLNDSHPHVRGRLAHLLISQPFFFEVIAPRLAVDPDWTVRANLARDCF